MSALENSHFNETELPLLLISSNISSNTVVLRMALNRCIEALTVRFASSRRRTSKYILRLKARFHYERGKEHSLFLLLILDGSERKKKSIKQTKNALVHARSGNGPLKARYERGKKHSLFVLLLFFALASILTARFNRRFIKERKNALFHAFSGNGPLPVINCDIKKLITMDSC